MIAIDPEAPDRFGLRPLVPEKGIEAATLNCRCRRFLRAFPMAGSAFLDGLTEIFRAVVFQIRPG